MTKAINTERRVQQLFILLLFVTALKGWLWSAIYPPFQPSDEIHHIGYARDISREHQWIVTPRDYFNGEEIIANRIAMVGEVSGYRRPLTLAPQQENKINQLKQALNDNSQQPPDEKSQFVRFFSQHHPPLYYSLGALISFIVHPDNILTHLAWARGISVLFGLVTVSFAYKTSQLLWPSYPASWIGIATLVSFSPMLTYLSSVYTNQALEITLFSTMLFLLLLVLQTRLTQRRAILLGIVMGLGLLTKTSFMAGIGLVIGVAAYNILRFRQIKPWGTVFFICTAIGSLWYFPYLADINTIVAIRQAETEQCMPLWNYAISAPIQHILTRTWRESLLSFGHRDTFLPAWIYSIVNWFFVLGLVGWLRYGLSRLIFRTTGETKHKPDTNHTAWILFVVAHIVVYLFYFIVAYTLSCSRLTEMQGRQMTILVIPLLLLLIQGWWHLFPKRQGFIMGAFVLLMMVLNWYSLNELVVKRYYGSQIILSTEVRNVLSDPLSAGGTISQCFEFQGEQTVNRFDMWLHHEPTTPKGALVYAFYRADGTLLLEGSSRNLGWVADYPAYAQFRPLKLTKGSCIQLSGSFNQPVQVWADSGSGGEWRDDGVVKEGYLAITVYEPVPWQEILPRVAIQSSDYYTQSFYQILGSIYGVAFFIFAALFFMRSGDMRSMQSLILRRVPKNK